MIIYVILTAKNECPASELYTYIAKMYIGYAFRLFLIPLEMRPKRNSHEKQIIMEGKHLISTHEVCIFDSIQH
jgi:hypothetical protein